MMGCRNGEIADISTLDIEQIDGFDILGINTKNRSKDQTVKTKESKRKLVIHPACVEEGFVDFVQSVVKTDGHGPLFRDITPDYYGRRAGPITSALSDWLRNVVQIKDPRKPFYSHRHTATSFLRNSLNEQGEPLVKESIERYILGHGRKGSHDGYGKRWFETLKRAIEVIPNPLESE